MAAGFVLDIHCANCAQAAGPPGKNLRIFLRPTLAVLVVVCRDCGREVFEMEIPEDHYLYELARTAFVSHLGPGETVQ